MYKCIEVLKSFFEKFYKRTYDVDKLTAVEQKEVIGSIIKKIRNSNELF